MFAIFEVSMNHKNKSGLFFRQQPAGLIRQVMLFALLLFSGYAAGQNITYSYSNLYSYEFMVKTFDGNLVFMAKDMNTSTSKNFSLVKTDSSGTVLWAKNIYRHANDFVIRIIYLPDSSFAYTLASDTNSTVGKIDANGNLLWSRLIMNPLFPFNVQLGGLFDAGGGNIIVRTTRNEYFKLDAAGNMCWKKRLIALNAPEKFEFSRGLLNGDKIFMTGTNTDLPITYFRIAFCQADTAGNFSTVKRYHAAPGIKLEYVNKMIKFGTDKYILAGAAGPLVSGNAYPMLMCIDTSGNPVWERTIGGIVSSFYDLEIDASLNIYALFAPSNFVNNIVKLQANGSITDGIVINHAIDNLLYDNNKFYLQERTPFWETLFSIADDSIGNSCGSQYAIPAIDTIVAPAIDTIPYIIDTTAFIFMVDTETVVTGFNLSKNIFCVTGMEEVKDDEDISVYPNPVSDRIHIHCREALKKDVKAEIFSYDKKIAAYDCCDIDLRSLPQG
ncbi:MAG TPA: hypothetical protein VJY62_01740, partial [Bacteroidia bacterium]|nr:hypothetical protein [Bacteroidia bacterium]